MIVITKQYHVIIRKIKINIPSLNYLNSRAQYL